jgi:hypothetical protein
MVTLMRITAIILSAFLTFCLSARIITGQEQPAKEDIEKKVRQLLVQLGSDKYRERESAQKQLGNILTTHPGKALGLILKTYRTTKDIEVRLRLERMAPLRIIHFYWGITPPVIKAIPNIIELLEKDSDESIGTVLKELGKLKPEDTRGVLVSAARHCASNELRVIDTLVKNADDEVVRLFIEQLKSSLS